MPGMLSIIRIFDISLAKSPFFLSQLVWKLCNPHMRTDPPSQFVMREFVKSHIILSLYPLVLPLSNLICKNYTHVVVQIRRIAASNRSSLIKKRKILWKGNFIHNKEIISTLVSFYSIFKPTTINTQQSIWTINFWKRIALESYKRYFSVTFL